MRTVTWPSSGYPSGTTGLDGTALDGTVAQGGELLQLRKLREAAVPEALLQTLRTARTKVSPRGGFGGVAVLVERVAA